MAKTYLVEKSVNAIINMSSPSEFDESSDSMESASEDRSWDEASTTSTRKTPLHGIGQRLGYD